MKRLLVAAIVLASCEAWAVPSRPLESNVPEETAYSRLLPCNTDNQGLTFVVKDANTQTPGDTISGTGSYRVTADCESGAWKVRGSSGAGGGVADPGAGGLMARTALNVSAPREIVTADSGYLAVTNGDGIAGNPELAIGPNLATTNGTNVFTGASTFGSSDYLGLPTASTCSETVSGSACVDTNGDTATFNAPFLYLRATGDRFAPLFTSLGADNTAQVYGKSATDVPTVYTVATAATASAIPQLDGSGLLAKAQIASGTPSASTFARGDGTWEEPLAGIAVNRIPFADANGAPSSDSTFYYDPVTDVVHMSGISIDPNLLDDTNGMTAATNEVSGGSMQSCSTASWHPGADTLSLGDLHAGASASYPGLCLEGSEAPTPRTYRSSITGATVGTAKNCAAFGQSGVWDHDTGGLANVAKAVSIDPSRNWRAVDATVLLANAATAANWVDEELIALRFYQCTLDATPAIADCTAFDAIVFEYDADGQADTTYGATTGACAGAASRTAETCSAGFPCLGSTVLDGCGLSPQGTPYAAAGAAGFDYWVVCWENDDASYTADATSDPGNLDLSIEVTTW